MKKLLVILVVLTTIAVLSAAAGILMSGGDRPLLGDSVLVWTVDRPIVDYRPPDTLLAAMGKERPSLGSLYRSLRAARRDDGVLGVAVYIHNARFGLAVAHELRSLLGSLREAGKFVECYLETAGEGSNGTLAYFLATACGSISLAPAGDLNLIGLYADGAFLRGTLEKLRIDPDFFHVGDFKSAAETFTEYGHTPAALAAVDRVLDSYYSFLLDEMTAAREISVERLAEVVDGAPYSAREALALGLVDRLAYPDEFAEYVRAQSEKDLQRVKIEDYRPGYGSRAAARVAVVFAQGSIVRGEGGTSPWGDQRYIGSTDTVALLGRLADDDQVRGVVLRIESPGGSAQASDLILRAVDLLAARKPLVVSMANVAASGGYYIAARAHTIVASPATLTGSIGVVGGKLVTRRFQQELLGISHDALKRGANADIYSSLQPFNEAQQGRFLHLMERTYEEFIDHVAEGRGMRREEVERAAGGRIWSGLDALDLGLVDRLGGLDEALAEVREAAGIDPEEELRLIYYPRPRSLLEELLQVRPAVPANQLLELLEDLDGDGRPWLELPHELAALAAPY